MPWDRPDRRAIESDPATGHYLVDLGAKLAVVPGQMVHLVLLGLQVVKGFLEGKIRMCVL